MTTLTNIAVDVVKRMGAARAKDGTHPVVPPNPNTTGFEGVDRPGRKYRARIAYCDALSGGFVRVTLGSFETAEDAGYAYKVAHVALWGALSYFVGAVTVEMIEAARAAGLADSTYAARGDNAGLCGK